MGIDVMKGSKSWLALAEEIDFNGNLAATPTYIWLMLLDESLALDFDEKSPDFITGKREDVVSQIFGSGISGDINFNPDVDTLPALLKWALGTMVSAQDGTSSAYTHTATINSTSALRSFKAFRNVGGLPSSPLLLKNNACKINEIELEVVKQDWMKGRANIIGRDEVDGSALTVGSEPSIFKLPVYDNCTAKVAAAGTTDFSSIAAADDIETVKLLLNNNLNKDDIIMDGTGRPRSIPEGKANVTVQLTSRDTASTEYNKFKDSGEFALDIIADTGVLIDDGNSLLKYGIEIILPRCKYTEYKLNISGKEQLTSTPAIRALYDTTAGFSIQAIVANAITGYPNPT